MPGFQKLTPTHKESTPIDNQSGPVKSDKQPIVQPRTYTRDAGGNNNSHESTNSTKTPIGDRAAILNKKITDRNPEPSLDKTKKDMTQENVLHDKIIKHSLCDQRLTLEENIILISDKLKMKAGNNGLLKKVVADVMKELSPPPRSPAPPVGGPPPPMNFGPVKTPTQKVTVDDPQAHLNAIQGGIKLRKAVINDRSGANTQGARQTSEIQQPEEMAKNFLPAALYLSTASWLTYKDKLKTMIKVAGGKPTGRKYLDMLMKKHAKHAGKAGNLNAVAGDRDAEGNLKASGSVIKSEYESYVIGREQTNDRNNDFNQNIDDYLDTYLEDLSQAATNNGSTLKAKMQEWFGIPSLVQRPQEFFSEYKELNEPLSKTGVQMQWLESGDITEEFIDGLISYEQNPKKIDSILEKIYAREVKKVKNKEADLNNAQKKHKSKILNLFKNK